MGGRISTNQLTYYVREGKYTELEEALRKYPDKINSRNKEGYTVLHEATKSGNLEILNFLISKNADTNVRAKETLRTPLHWACELYSLEIVHLLLLHGANPNMDDKFTGYAPIHLAVNNGNVEVVRLLKTYNANLNIQDKNGMSPLHHSCKNQDFEMTELLLELGSLPSITDSTNKMPFDYLPAKIPGSLRAWKKKFKKQLKLQSESPPSSKNSSVVIMTPNSINNSINGNNNNNNNNSSNNNIIHSASSSRRNSDTKENMSQTVSPRPSITSNTPFTASVVTPTATTTNTTNITIDTSSKPPIRNKYSSLYMTTTTTASTTPTSNTSTNLTTTTTTHDFHNNNFSNSYHTASTAGMDSYDLYRMDSSVSSSGLGMSILSFNGLYPNSSSNSGGDDRNTMSGVKSPYLPPSLNNCGVCGLQFRSFSHHSRKRKTVVPKLLACLHNICEDCLKAQLQHQLDSNNNNPTIPLYVICPHCHEHSPPTVSAYHLNNNFEDYGLLHVHGASSPLAPTTTGHYDYADDYFTMYLQELCKSILPIYCTTCREKKNKLNLANYYCLDCASSTSTTTATSSSPHTSTISPVPSPGISRPNSYSRLDTTTTFSLQPSPIQVNALLSNDIVPSSTSEDISLSASTNTSDTVYFCDMCKYSHEISNTPNSAMSRTSMGSSYHRVVFINNPSVSSLPHCKHHIDYPYTLFCNNCKVPVCELCRVSARHGSHMFENLKDALEKHVEVALGGNLEKARGLLSNLGVCKSSLDGASEALSRQKESIEAEINTYFDVFKQQLEFKRREAIGELMSAYDVKNNRINNLKNEITTKITGLETVTDYISRGIHLSSDAYFLHTTSVISSRLQKLIDRGGFNGTVESTEMYVAGLLEAKILQTKLMKELKIKCKIDNNNHHSDVESTGSTPPLDIRNSTTGLRGYGPKIRSQYSNGGGYNTISGSNSYSSNNYYTTSPDGGIATLSSIYKQEDSPLLQYSSASLHGLPYDSQLLSQSTEGGSLARSNSSVVSPHINSMYSKYNYPQKHTDSKSITSNTTTTRTQYTSKYQGGARDDKNNNEYSKSFETYNYNKRASTGSSRNHHVNNI